VEIDRLLQTQRATDAAPAPADQKSVSSNLGDSANLQSPHTTGELNPPQNVSEDIGLKTRASIQADADEDLTVVAAPRTSRPFESESDARRVEPTPGVGAGPSEPPPPQPPPDSAVQPPHPTSPSTGALTHRRRVWPYVLAGAAVLLLLFGAGVSFVAWRLLRQSPPVEVTQAPTPPPDLAQQVEAKLAEAESLLASGQSEAAIAKLREANTLDPANWKGHRRLGDLLAESGQRREAVEEYRLAAQNNPEDFTLWRALGSTQLAEGMNAEAVESYRRLISVVGGEASADGNDLLAFGDALRLSGLPGHLEESRGVYQKLAAGPNGEVAATAKQRLVELAHPTPTPSPLKNENANERATPTPTPTPGSTPPATSTPAPAPTPATSQVRPGDLSPSDAYQRGVQLWPGNRGEALAFFRAAARGGNSDANFYLGLSYVEGRDLSSLKRAELLAALQHFQNAQRGQHAARARQYADQLEKEFDRIRTPSP
jgi:Tfp pilus assembly protein PilF